MCIFKRERAGLKNPIDNLVIIGRTFEADFGEKAFTLFYESPRKLILTEIRGL